MWNLVPYKYSYLQSNTTSCCFNIMQLSLNFWFFFPFCYFFLIYILTSLLKETVLGSLPGIWKQCGKTDLFIFFFVESQNVYNWNADKLLIYTLQSNKKLFSICSIAFGSTNVHLPMGGFKWLGPKIIRAIISCLPRILHLCQVL